MFLQGRVHSDIFNQGKLLLNGRPLKVTFQRHKNNFALLSAAENPEFKLSFQEVIFCLRKVQLSLHKFQSIQQRLEKTPALYPFNRIEIKTHSVAQGLSSLNWENAMLGQIPEFTYRFGYYSSQSFQIDVLGTVIHLIYDSWVWRS